MYKVLLAAGFASKDLCFDSRQSPEVLLFPKTCTTHMQPTVQPTSLVLGLCVSRGLYGPGS